MVVWPRLPADPAFPRTYSTIGSRRQPNPGQHYLQESVGDGASYLRRSREPKINCGAYVTLDAFDIVPSVSV